MNNFYELFFNYNFQKKSADFESLKTGSISEETKIHISLVHLKIN